MPNIRTCNNRARFKSLKKRFCFAGGYIIDLDRLDYSNAVARRMIIADTKKDIDYVPKT